jgi:hypothetical protein
LKEKLARENKEQKSALLKGRLLRYETLKEYLQDERG